MAYTDLAEHAALDRMEPRWRDLGYNLIRKPDPEQLPDFLKGFVPDAIAVGPQPSLVIEVVNPLSGTTKTRVAQLSSLFADQEGWRLEIVYAPADAQEIRISPGEDIEEILQLSRRLASRDPRAALLIAWAALEAAGRSLHPDLASQGLSSGSLIDLLVSHGDLNPRDQDGLRAIARKRNAVAHGEFDLPVTREEVMRIVDLGRMLRSRAEHA